MDKSKRRLSYKNNERKDRPYSPSFDGVADLCICTYREFMSVNEHYIADTGCTYLVLETFYTWCNQIVFHTQSSIQ